MQRPISEPKIPRDPPRHDGYAEGWSRTVVSQRVAVWLSVLFSAGLLAVPLADGLLGAWRDPASKAEEGIARIVRCFNSQGFRWPAVVEANSAALGAIKNFESSLEDSSALAASVRPQSLDGLLRIGGAGSEEAYIGRDGWLFYRPDVDALVMRTASSDQVARGIADFAAQLAARGIRLVLVPVPGKASIHPEKLAPEGTTFRVPPVPPVLSGLAPKIAAAWREMKIFDSSLAPQVFDTTTLLWRRKTEGNGDQFLHTDSHWAPGAMRAAAEAVSHVLSGVPLGAREELTPHPRQVSAIGDTALMLNIPASSPLSALQTVAIETVAGAGGEQWRADRACPVLVLGDSYTNIFSSEDLGWGSASGFAEQLSRSLGCRVDKLARNDAGAKSAREMLAAETARNPGWLDGKKVVVWVMAAREFVRGDWSDVKLPGVVSSSAQREFFVVPPGADREVTAEVVSLGKVPAAADSPYADYLTALLLANLEDAATGAKISGETLAYIFSMRDHKIVPLPGLAEGRRVKLRLSSYADKAHKLDSLNRGDLEDFEVMMEEPNFAEWIAPH